MPIYSDVVARLDEKAVQTVIRELESQFESGATGLGQAFSKAFTAASSNFGQGLSESLRQSIGELGILGKTADSALGGIPLKAAAAATGIGLVAVAAVQTGQALYDIGERFDNVADRISARTNAIGGDMDRLNESLRESFRNSSSSLEQVGEVLTGVTQSLHLTGQAAVEVTNQIDDFTRMTGQSVNIRELGRALAGFGVDASQAASTLDMLYTASAGSGIPIDELTTNLRNAGPAARTLGLNLGELTNLFTKFEQGGIAGSASTQMLNSAAKVFADSGIDMQTGLADTITQLRGFIDTGNEAAAVDLAGKVFGERGAQRFVDLIRQGRIGVGDLNTELANTQDAIAKQDEATRGWREEWDKLKNNVTDLANNIGDPLFQAVDKVARRALEFANAMLAPNYGGESMSTGPGMVASTPFTPGAFLPGVALPDGTPAAAGTPDRDRLAAQLPFLGGVIGLPAAEAAPPQDIAAAVETATAAATAAAPAAAAPAPAATPAIPAAQVPFPAGYGAAPRPGQSSQSYAAEQAVYEAQQKRAEAAARLAQVEQTATATAEDLVEARNRLAQAEVDEHQAQIRLTESATQATEQLEGVGVELAEVGAKLDADFGFSKGLPGIVENITRMLAGFAAAPVIGALSGVQSGLGYKPGEAGSGLVGIMAASGAFGDQFTRATPSAPSGAFIPPYNPAVTLPASPATGVAAGGYAAGSYPGDAALLSMVPAGRYTQDERGDLTQGLADCTSSIEDLVNLMDGRPTAGASLSTSNAAEWLTSRGFLPGSMPGAFNVGFWDGPGNQGHMQATLPGGTPFNWGSDASAANRGIGGTGADDPELTQRYYRPVGAGGAVGVGSVMLGGQSLPLPLPVTIVGGMGGGAIPGLPGLPTTAAPSSPSGAGGGGATSSGGGYAPLTAEQLTSTALTNPTPTGGAGGGLLGGLTGASPSLPTVTAAGGGGIATQLFPGLAGAGPQAGGASAGGGTGTGGFFPGLGGPPQAGGASLAFPTPGGGPSAGPTLIGGLAPPEGTGSGFGGISGGILGAALGAASQGAGLAASAAAGGMDGGAGGAAASAATQIGIQLLNRAIQQGGQVAGIAASGLIETLVPFGASELAQNNWLTKIVGGIVGARPVLPNLAGGGKKTPEGLTPQQAAQMEQGQGGPTPEQVAGQPAAAQQGGGAGGNTVNNNVTVNNQRQTEDGTGRDVTWHLGQMYSGPGQ